MTSFLWRAFQGALALFLSALIPSLAMAQDVEFLDEAPQADGKLSPAEEALALRTFPEAYRFDNPDVEAPDIAYRVGYTARHLYVAITTTAPEITYRNRGYLWGDGWRLLLGDPSDGSRTATYIEVLVSPKAQGDDRIEMAVGTQDNVQVFRRLSPASRSAEGALPNGTVFEAVIAWADLAPFHPLFDPRIGMNLYFAKGLSAPEAGDFPYGYALVRDEGIWEEQIASRAIAPFLFDLEEAAGLQGKVQYRLASRHIVAGRPIRIETAQIAHERAAGGRREVLGEVTIAPEGSQGAGAIPLTPRRDVIRSDFTLPSEGLSPGAHTITLPDQSRHTLWVLPDFAPQAAREAILEGGGALSPGTRDALQFLLSSHETKRAALQPYANASAVLEEALRLVEMTSRAAQGASPFEGIEGPYRRGFRSALDGSFQPYSVNLPEGFSSDGSYPALVFLHGSGADEQGLLESPRSNGRMIEVAPYGRDKFFAYASKASQIDIAEALDAAARDFPIDRDRVVIGGFSMGGYGALRGFYEHPERYKGVAVFAGHPDLANEWLGNLGFPNFLDPAFTAPFKGVPVFIYHGQKDSALPYGLAVKLAEALRKAGARVTFAGPEEMGHQYQDPQTHARFVQWLEQF